jgi:hypothetical protein
MNVADVLHRLRNRSREAEAANLVPLHMICGSDCCA